MRNLKVLITEKQIEKRLEELSQEIEKQYKEKELVMLCVLKGSIMFTADLARKINKKNLQLEFIELSSYSDTESTGKVKLNKDIKQSIKGKDVLVVEDIIDTGRTIKFLKEHLKEKEPNSVRICTLLDKPSRREVDIKADYVGFEIENKFVVGYGLDYNEDFRNLPYIGYIM